MAGSPKRIGPVVYLIKLFVERETALPLDSIESCWR